MTLIRHSDILKGQRTCPYDPFGLFALVSELPALNSEPFALVSELSLHPSRVIGTAFLKHDAVGFYLLLVEQVVYVDCQRHVLLLKSLSKVNDFGRIFPYFACLFSVLRVTGTPL